MVRGKEERDKRREGGGDMWRKGEMMGGRKGNMTFLHS